MNNLFVFPHKKIRAEVIKNHLNKSRYKKVVCFSCGNAAVALINAGIETLHIGENGDFLPNKWFNQTEINNIYPDYFDATSGHLTIEIMFLLGKAYKQYLGELMKKTIYVPTGSGETLVCLKMVYPETQFVAVYNLNAATQYNEKAPLNNLVKLLSNEIIFADIN